MLLLNKQSLQCWFCVLRKRYIQYIVYDRVILIYMSVRRFLGQTNGHQNTHKKENAAGVGERERKTSCSCVSIRTRFV